MAAPTVAPSFLTRSLGRLKSGCEAAPSVGGVLRGLERWLWSFGIGGRRAAGSSGRRGQQVAFPEGALGDAARDKVRALR